MLLQKVLTSGLRTTIASFTVSVWINPQLNYLFLPNEIHIRLAIQEV